MLYLQRLLGLLPWTRGVANRLLDYVVQPLAAMGHGLVREIPDLIVLGIIFLLTRYLLRVVHLFFGAVGRGEVTWSGFQAEWAEPTYKLLRAGVVAFAVVVGFPYVPGSGSEAF